MEKEALGRALLQAAYLEGDFVLRSGRRSRYYLDKYLFETDPQVLRGIVHEMALMVRNRLALGNTYERLAAPELGGIVLGAVCPLSSVCRCCWCVGWRRTMGPRNGLRGGSLRGEGRPDRGHSDLGRSRPAGGRRPP